MAFSFQYWWNASKYSLKSWQFHPNTPVQNLTYFPRCTTILPPNNRGKQGGSFPWATRTWIIWESTEMHKQLNNSYYKGEQENESSCRNDLREMFGPLRRRPQNAATANPLKQFCDAAEFQQKHVIQIKIQTRSLREHKNNSPEVPCQSPVPQSSAQQPPSHWP